MPGFPTKLEDKIGKEVLDPFRQAVKSGDFQVSHAEELAGSLDKEVRGTFIHRKNVRTFTFSDKETDKIFDDWFRKCACLMSNNDIIDKICSALDDIEQKPIAYSIKQKYAERPEDNGIDPNSESPMLPPTSSFNPVLTETEHATQGVQMVQISSGESSNFFWSLFSKNPKISFSLFVFISALIMIIAGIIIGQCYYAKEHTLSSCSGGAQTTRSIKIVKGQVKEFHKCLEDQHTIPDFPIYLNGSVGIHTKELGILVCGGKGGEDRDHEPKLCYTHKLGSVKWVERVEFKLNTNRVGSYVKFSDNKIFIIGGVSSDINYDCKASQEILDLGKIAAGTSEGWTEEATRDEECFEMNFVSELPLTIDIPCFSL